MELRRGKLRAGILSGRRGVFHSAESVGERGPWRKLKANFRLMFTRSSGRAVDACPAHSATGKVGFRTRSGNECAVTRPGARAQSNCGAVVTSWSHGGSGERRMWAPVRKRRLRGSRSDRGEQQPVPGRRSRARNRLVASVVVVAVAVAAAGAPAIAAAIDDVKDAQRDVDRAEAAVAAVALAHSLADERDAMTEYVATGRSTASGEGVPKSVRSRVDRQIAKLRDTASDASVTFADATKRLGDLQKARQRALSGPDSATEVFDGYTRVVQALHRAVGATDPDALRPLGRAVEQASGSRALLLGALASGGRQPGLTAAAYRTHLREEAAFADFEQGAPSAVRKRYARTVNGKQVTAAERYLARLTDASQDTSTELTWDRERVGVALTARLNRMRSVEAALTAERLAHAEEAYDEQITALELSAALLIGCLLLAVGVSAYATRSVTRPLATLRVGARRLAEDPAGAEPITLRRRETVRANEIADVVRAVNQLYEGLGSQRARVAKLAAERGHLIEERQHLAAQIAEIRQECEDLRRLKDEIEARLNGLRERVHSSFVNLALRTLGLVERQLAVIETMEESEQDPERLDTLFTLDHLATGIRRYSENLLVIAGSERQSNHPGPVPLLDVLRAAISEVERYQRIRIQALPPQAQVAGFAADSVSHLIAELLENATVFSPPGTEVHVSGWLLENGEVMLSVQDEGIGMTAERFDELNARLADPVPDYCQGPQPEDPLGLGLYVVTRLAARHGVRVQLREQKQGGVTAVVVLPKAILPEPSPPVGGVRPVALSGDRSGAASGAPSLPRGQAGTAASATQAHEERTDLAEAQQPVPSQVRYGLDTHEGSHQPADHDPSHPRSVRTAADSARTAADSVRAVTDSARTAVDGGSGAPAASREPSVPAARQAPTAAETPTPARGLSTPPTGPTPTAPPHTELPVRTSSATYADPRPTPRSTVDAVPGASEELYDHGDATTPRGATFSGVGTATRVSGVAPAPGTEPQADAGPTALAQPTGRRRGRRTEPALSGSHDHPEHRRPELGGAMPSAGEPWGPGATPTGPRAGEPGEGESGPGGASAGGAGADDTAGQPRALAPHRSRARGTADAPQGPAGPGDAGPEPAPGAAGPAVAPRPDPLVVAAERAVEASARQAREAMRATAAEPTAARPSPWGESPTDDGRTSAPLPTPPLHTAPTRPTAPRPQEPQPIDPQPGHPQVGEPGSGGPLLGGAPTSHPRPSGPYAGDPGADGLRASGGAHASDSVPASEGPYVNDGASAPPAGYPSPDGPQVDGPRTGDTHARDRHTDVLRPGSPGVGEPLPEGARVGGPRTDKGLPKRTPRVVAPRKAEAGERRKIDAEVLRRRLGGFQQGAREGRRDAEAEIAERIAAQREHLPRARQGERPAPPARSAVAPGGAQLSQGTDGQGPGGPPTGDRSARQGEPGHALIDGSPHGRPVPEPSSSTSGVRPQSDEQPSPEPSLPGPERIDRSMYDQEQHHQSPYDQERYDQPPYGRQPADRQPEQRHTQHQAGAQDQGETVEEARS